MHHTGAPPAELQDRGLYLPEAEKPLTFSAFERMQRMKKGSAFPRVSRSLLRDVWGKREKALSWGPKAAPVSGMGPRSPVAASVQGLVRLHQ